MNLALQNRALLGDVISLITRTSFVMFGLMALVVAAIRRRKKGVRAIVLLGIWTIIYGSQAFNYNSLLLSLEPPWMVAGAHYMRAATTYLPLLVGLLTFRELTLGFVRKVLGAMAIVAGIIAVLGFGRFVLTYNELLATISLLFLAALSDFTKVCPQI